MAPRSSKSGDLRPNNPLLSERGEDLAPINPNMVEKGADLGEELFEIRVEEPPQAVYEGNYDAGFDMDFVNDSDDEEMSTNAGLLNQII